MSRGSTWGEEETRFELKSKDLIRSQQEKNIQKCRHFTNIMPLK